jgi:hypothetical protein
VLPRPPPQLLQLVPQPHTQVWFDEQIMPAPQAPHVPPHPSLPHILPLQLGTQTQTPVGLHVSPDVQEPHVPPHPSGPHVLPPQVGAQAHWPEELHAWPGGQEPQAAPHPSLPHALAAQLGTQTHRPAELHVSLAVQAPQVPPHPSGPQVLPPQFVGHESTTVASAWAASPRLGSPASIGASIAESTSVRPLSALRSPGPRDASSAAVAPGFSPPTVDESSEPTTVASLDEQAETTTASAKEGIATLTSRPRPWQNPVMAQSPCKPVSPVGRPDERQ